jgi:hypothetical protein
MLDPYETTKLYLDYNKDYEEMVGDIKEDKNWFPETYLDAFVIAVSVAVKKQLDPIPLNKKEINQKNQIRIGIVVKDKHKTFFRAVAFSHTKNIEIIKNMDSVYEIAEMFANAGFREISDEYFNKVENPSFQLAEMGMKN